MAKVIQEASVDTKLLYARIRNAQPGDLITNDELSSIVNVPIATRRNCLNTARDMAIREDGIVFDCVRGLGIKRLHEHEVAQLGPQFFSKVRRGAKRVARKLVSGVKDFEALSPEAKTAHNMTLSITGALLQGLRPSRVKEIERTVQNGSAVLPVAKTLELFKG